MKSKLERMSPWMTVQEACEYLGITKRLMDNLTSQKRVAYVLCGGRKFRKEWLDDYMTKNTIPAAN